MEKKSSNKLVITLIIIIICLVLGGGYTIYTLLPSNSNTGNIDNENKTENTNQNNQEDNTDVIDENINIKVENIDVNQGYYILYSGIKDNKTIWTYKTQISITGAQFQQAGTLKEYNDKIYIFDLDKIVVLDKTDGKTLWTVSGLESLTVWGCSGFDTKGNMYQYGTDINIYDEKGNKKTINYNNPIGHPEGVIFNFVNDKELLIEGRGIISVNLEKNTINYELGFVEGSNGLPISIRKTDANNKVLWEYETNYGYDFILDDIIYISEKNQLTSLNMETGKVLWKNLEKFDGGYLSENSACHDSKGNLYLIQKVSPNLWIIDKNGKTIKKIDKLNLRADLQVYMHVEELSLRNNEKELVATIHDNENIIINLKDYSIKYEK